MSEPTRYEKHERIREVYPLDRKPCAWCNSRKTHHYDCPVPDVHALLSDVAALTAQLAEAQRGIEARDAVLREHAEFGNLFQPGGRFCADAKLLLGRSAVVEGGRWLVAAYDAAKRERDEAMRVLAPNVPESGLVDACRQIKQAAISEADNSSVCEAKITAAQAENTALREALAETVSLIEMWQEVDRSEAPTAGRYIALTRDTWLARRRAALLGGQPPPEDSDGRCNERVDRDRSGGGAAGVVLSWVVGA